MCKVCKVRDGAENAGDKKPTVSIGLPVYNGEQYIRQTLESILAQTFTDFELIISDNASTDATGEICEEFAAKDDRVRYYRAAENFGAAWNHNIVFEKASGKYFKWSACDDLCEPTFIEKCVKVLDNEPSVILCHPKTTLINAEGEFVRNYDISLATENPAPHKRFADLVCVNHFCQQIFGIVRSDVLLKTPLFEAYKGGDRVLLARLGLLGPFRQVDEYLFLNRAHPGQSVQLWRNPDEYYVWWDPRHEGSMVFPEWRLLRECVSSVRNAGLESRERRLCYRTIFRWLITSGRPSRMVFELIRPVEIKIPVSRYIFNMFRKVKRWMRRCLSAMRGKTAEEG